jgi:predicted metal-dependent hydrolase
MEEISYSVVYSRRRSISIIVSPHDGVTVRAPYRTSDADIKKFVQKKSEWIKKHIDGFSKLTRIGHEGRPGAEESQMFLRRVNEIVFKYQAYNFHPENVVVRPLKTRWGSCTSKGKITINSSLINLDEKILEYVVVHELCHLRHHNHGKEFHKLLGELIPDYIAIRRELGKYLIK